METKIYGLEVYPIPDTNEAVAGLLLRLVKHYGNPADCNTIFDEYEETLRSRNYDERLNIEGMFYHWITYFEELLQNFLAEKGLKYWTGNDNLCIG